MNEIENITIGTVLEQVRISMLERNIKQPTITTVFLLAEALEMKPSDFVQLLEDEFEGHTIKRTTV